MIINNQHFIIGILSWLIATLGFIIIFIILNRLSKQDYGSVGLDETLGLCKCLNEECKGYSQIHGETK